MSLTLIERIMKELEEAQNHRATMDEHLQEIADFVLTRRATFTTTYTPGSKRTRKQFDATAPWANEQLANGMHSMLTSPAARWFYMRATDYNVSTIFRVREWVEDVTHTMYHEVFNSPSSGFHSQIHEVYLDSGALGTAIAFSKGVPGGGLVFKAKHLGNCYYLENANGMVDTMYQDFMWPVHKVIDRWGMDVLPPEKKKALMDGNQVPDLRIVHCVKPNRMFNMMRVRTRTNMEFASVYLLVEPEQNKKATLMEQGGFHEFPYHVFRFLKRTGEQWGEGPGMRALPDIKMVNEMKKTVLKGAQKIVDPPLQLPDDGFLGPVLTRPGGLNYYRAGSVDRIEPIETRARPDIGRDLIRDVQDDIQRAFYVDAFHTPDEKEGVNVKAAFVLQRREEKFRQLGPMLARAEQEFLGPLIERTYMELWRQGAFPPPPPELEEQGVTIEYISPIARAQRATEAEDVQRLMALVAPVGEIDPGVWDNFDSDGLVRVGAEELYSVPTRMLRSPEEVAALREKREQQEAANAQLGQLQAGAAAAKDLSTAISNVQGT